MMRPIRQLGFFHAQAINVPVVSFNTAITSIWMSPRLAIASLEMNELFSYGIDNSK